MFERYILASNYNRIMGKYPLLKIPESLYFPSYNILPGQLSLVITGGESNSRFGEFGLRGFKEILPFIRSEGDRNKHDDIHYRGAKAILQKPGIKHLVYSQRCLVPADAFVVGIGRNEPYLIYLRDKKRPFSFAGIWNKTIDVDSIENVFSFGIITTTANPLLTCLGMIRMPVILDERNEVKWLKPTTPLSEISGMLEAYPERLMNAYRISMKIADEGLNDVSLVKPVGKPVIEEHEFGLLPRRKGKRFTENNIMLAERLKGKN